ncbi:MAG: hypothetical protein DMG77_19490, partial [Acidobacteria bacterium]
FQLIGVKCGFARPWPCWRGPGPFLFPGKPSQTRKGNNGEPAFRKVSAPRTPAVSTTLRASTAH